MGSGWGSPLEGVSVEELVPNAPDLRVVPIGIVGVVDCFFDLGLPPVTLLQSVEAVAFSDDRCVRHLLRIHALLELV